MAKPTPSPTISLRERPLSVSGAEEPLPKWLTFSFLLHAALISMLFLAPFLPAKRQPIQEAYTVDLVGGERIGKANFGTELVAAPKAAPPPVVSKPAVAIPEAKQPVKQGGQKVTQDKIKVAPTEKAKADTVKAQPGRQANESEGSETASADSVRERLLQSALERAKSKTEAGVKGSQGELLSAGTGEGLGAAAIGPGGRGGPGIVKGIDFIVYRNRMLNTIKENWAWVGQRSNLSVVVYFSVRENGEIVGLKIIKPSGDPSFDESVLRALKKSNPLPEPPADYRKDFAEVELTFRPSDLGA